MDALADGAGAGAGAGAAGATTGAGAGAETGSAAATGSAAGVATAGPAVFLRLNQAIADASCVRSPTSVTQKSTLGSETSETIEDRITRPKPLDVWRATSLIAS